MLVAEQKCHILALEIVGRARESEDDLSRSLAILSELAVSMPAYEAASGAGTLVTHPVRGGLYLLFLEDSTGPVRLALELADLFQELPSLTVRMAIHSGVVLADSGDRMVGDGIREVDELLREAVAGEIALSATYAEMLQASGGLAEHVESDAGRYVIRPQRLMLVGATSELKPTLEAALAQDGHLVDDDTSASQTLAWARSLEERIRSADTVVALVGDESGNDELLQYQLEIAADERRKRGFPQILPVWLKNGPAPEGDLSALHHNLHQATWSGPRDEARVVEEVRSVLASGQEEIDPEFLETPGGAVSTDSRFYVRRTADAGLEAAIRRKESIVLLKGPRQIGKTSLIGHGVSVANGEGWRTALTDFQKLSSRQLQSEESFCRVIATTLAHQLGVSFDFDTEWFEPLGGNLNLDRFVRGFLDASADPIVWFIDEADRLFMSPFASDFFALIRSWHNSRATERNGPWHRLIVVIGYATEAHLFISDMNQSPFNVGRPVDIPMFSLENTIDLNDRYGKPIPNEADVALLHSLVEGQPYLTRRAFDTIASRATTFSELIRDAHSEDGPFGDHLKRMLASVTQLPEVWEALVQSLSNPAVPESNGIYRLIAAGVLVRRADKRLDLRCELYRRFLAQYLPK